MADYKLLESLPDWREEGRLFDDDSSAREKKKKQEREKFEGEILVLLTTLSIYLPSAVYQGEGLWSDGLPVNLALPSPGSWRMGAYDLLVCFWGRLFMLIALLDPFFDYTLAMFIVCLVVEEE